MKLVVEVNLANDAMQDGYDAMQDGYDAYQAIAKSGIASARRHNLVDLIGTWNTIRDDNGNTVGHWAVTK